MMGTRRDLTLQPSDDPRAGSAVLVVRNETSIEQILQVSELCIGRTTATNFGEWRGAHQWPPLFRSGPSLLERMELEVVILLKDDHSAKCERDA
jgi:hypothetical protein